MRRHADKDFVQAGGKDEGQDLRGSRVHAAPDQRSVYVTFHELGHGFVPGCPVGPDVGAVPPVAVEFAVAKPHHFGEGIERSLEESVEAGKPADDTDCAKLEDALKEIDQVQLGDVRETVLQKWYGVLS